MFVPNTIILDSSPYVWLAKEHLARLTMHQLEISEFTHRLLNALTFQNTAHARLLLCVSSIKDEYSQCFDSEELKHLENILLQYGMAMYRHLLRNNAYVIGDGVFPYAVSGMIGNDIVLVFDFSDQESNLW